MTEDLILPLSLQRLEITHERPESSKFEENNPFSVPGLAETQPECFFESLSLKATCSKGNCLCNKKKDPEEQQDEVLKKLKGIQKRSVLRKSRLHNVVLRAPLLKLNEVKSSPPPGVAGAGAQGGKEPEERLMARSEEDAGGEGGSRLTPVRSILRAPVLRIEGGLTAPPCASYHTQPTLSTPREDLAGGGGGGGGVSRTSNTSASALCAVQARNPAPDDTNIEELASYFDLFVHIPKKMSLMAEMMYI